MNPIDNDNVIFPKFPNLFLRYPYGNYLRIFRMESKLLLNSLCCLIWLTREIIEGERCANKIVEKYKNGIPVDEFRYVVCSIITPTVPVCFGVLVKTDTLVLRNCSESTGSVCCRGPKGLEVKDKCSEIIERYEDGPNIFLKLAKHRRIMDLIWEENVLQANDCASFNMFQPVKAATLDKAEMGYTVRCDCMYGKCHAGDALVCDDYLAGIITAQGKQFKLALFRSIFAFKRKPPTLARYKYNRKKPVVIFADGCNLSITYLTIVGVILVSVTITRVILKFE